MSTYYGAKTSREDIEALNDVTKRLRNIVGSSANHGIASRGKQRDLLET